MDTPSGDVFYSINTIIVHVSNFVKPTDCYLKSSGCTGRPDP